MFVQAQTPSGRSLPVAADNPTCFELRSLLKDSIEQNRTKTILLSGGLDSTALASVLKPELAITVAGSAAAPDVEHSKSAAVQFCLKHDVIFIDSQLLPNLVETVISTMKTFDPTEIRNSIVALAGIRHTKRSGYDSVMTGDGGDELFAGYNYLARYYHDSKRLQEELERLWKIMHFSSLRLSEVENIRVATPFLDPQFSEYAKALSVQKKVGMHNGKMWGKFILRSCFEPMLGQLAWRPKMAQEEGSGITSVIQIFVDNSIDDDKYERATQSATSQHVKLRSKEHAYYYQIFLKYFKPPGEQRQTAGSELRCPECGALFESAGKFCRTCGAYPVTPE